MMASKPSSTPSSRWQTRAARVVGWIGVSSVVDTVRESEFYL